MADSTIIINGETENQAAEDFYDADEAAKVTELDTKIKALESEKLNLSDENSELKEKIKKATIEIDQLRSKEEQTKEEMDQWEEDKRVIQSVTARSADLEIEVSRLQHDLITSMSDVDEANKELIKLKEDLEEKASAIERLDKEIAELKKEKVESEKRERGLERKIGILEVREMEERSKKVRVEEEMKVKIDELKKKVEELKVELETSKEEKRESEEEAKEMKSKLLELKEVVEKKTAESINGKSREIFETAGSKEKGLNVTPLVVAGSAGAVVVAVAVVYLCFRKRS